MKNNKEKNAVRYQPKFNKRAIEAYIFRIRFNNQSVNHHSKQK